MFGKFVEEHAANNYNDVIVAFLLCCDLMDIFMNLTHSTDPDHLEKTIESFLAACVVAGWLSLLTKKFHWILHYPQHLKKFVKKFGCLPKCFVLERKHRLLKRFATAVRNTHDFGASIYREVLNHELYQLQDPDVFRTGVFLKQPRHPTKKILTWISLLLDRDLTMEEVLVSNVAHVDPDGYCSKGDVCLLKPDAHEATIGPWSACKVVFHCEIEQQLLSLVTVYSLKHYDEKLYAATWKVQETVEFVHTSDLICSLIYMPSKQGTEVITLIPYLHR